MKISPINRYNAFVFAVKKVCEHLGLLMSLMVTGAAIFVFRFGLLGLVMGAHTVNFFKSGQNVIIPQFGLVFKNMTLAWWVLALCVFIALKLVQSMYTLGLTMVTLKIYDGKKVSYIDLFSRIFTSWKHVIASGIYYGLFALMLVPTFMLAYKSGFKSPIFVTSFVVDSIVALWLAVRFWFFQHLIADKQYGPFKALRESWKMTKESFAFLFGFIFLLAIEISLLLPLSKMGPVYMLVILPLAFLADSYVYRAFVPKAK